jgi:hypothetical protein
MQHGRGAPEIQDRGNLIESEWFHQAKGIAVQHIQTKEGLVSPDRKRQRVAYQALQYPHSNENYQKDPPSADTGDDP